MSVHPSRKEFQRFLLDASQPANAAPHARIVRHLLAGCPICREELDQMGWGGARLERLLTLRASEIESSPFARYDYSQAFAGAERALAAFFAKGSAPAVAAETLQAELAGLSAEEQIRLVGSDRRFASPDLIRQWIQESQTVRFDNPEKVFHLAHLACLASESCTAEETGSPERLADLRAQGWLQYGNALRVKGRFRESDAAFSRAQRYCEAGTGDPPVRARLLTHVVSLRISQRRFDEAIQLADEAARIYKEIGQNTSWASCMVQKAVACIYAEDPETAVRTLNRAIPMIDPAGDPHLLLAACHNLVRCYVGLDRPDQALSLYFESRELYREFNDSLILLRAGWQEGQLLRDLGYLQAAEASLVHARDGFVERQLQYDAALISLDLAAIYIRLGDAEKLHEIVAVTVPIFRSLGVDREAIAALLQLQQLSNQSRKAFEVIRSLSASLERLGREAS